LKKGIEKNHLERATAKEMLEYIEENCQNFDDENYHREAGFTDLDNLE